MHTNLTFSSPGRGSATRPWTIPQAFIVCLSSLEGQSRWKIWTGLSRPAGGGKLVKFRKFPRKSTESRRCSEGPAGVAGVHIRCVGLRLAPPDAGETNLSPSIYIIYTIILYILIYIMDMPPPPGESNGCPNKPVRDLLSLPRRPILGSGRSWPCRFGR